MDHSTRPCVILDSYRPVCAIWHVPGGVRAGTVLGMDIEQIWSACLAILALATNYVAGNRKRYAWVIGMGSQVGWLGFIVLTGNYGFVISLVGFTWVYIRNYVAWGREERPALST